MVLKSKGGKKCRSSLSGKKKKQMMKHHRKTNYKKKHIQPIECSICYNEVQDCSDNVVTCGKSHHPLCSNCKLKCKECPMCRSHSIKPPISQDIDIDIYSSSCKHPSNSPAKMLSVYGDCWLDGSYKEIRRDKNNYPVFQGIDSPEVYIQKGPHYYPQKHEGLIQWLFTTKCENTYSRHRTAWAFRQGKLIGKHTWEIGFQQPDDFDSKSEWISIPISISRI